MARFDPAFGWKTHGDSSADADFALQIQGAAVLFDEGLGQRQAKAGALVLAVQITVDLPKPSHNPFACLLRRLGDQIEQT